MSRAEHRHHVGEAEQTRPMSSERKPCTFSLATSLRINAAASARATPAFPRSRRQRQRRLRTARPQPDHRCGEDHQAGIVRRARAASRSAERPLTTGRRTRETGLSNTRVNTRYTRRQSANITSTADPDDHRPQSTRASATAPRLARGSHAGVPMTTCSPSGENREGPSASHRPQ